MNLLYVVPAMYPYGWAYASRALNLTRLAKAAGCEVTVISDYLSDGIARNENNSAEFENVKILYTTGKYASERKLKQKILVTRIIKPFIEQYLENNSVDIILCAMTGGKYSTIQKIAEKHKIPIILEVCEWYSHKNWKYGWIDPRYLKFIFDWNYILPKARRVLCISSLLEKHFSNSGVKTVRIPTILNTDGIEHKDYKKCHFPIRLVFIGGITGGKDELGTLINVICSYDLPYVLNIYGPNKKEVSKVLKGFRLDKNKFAEKIHINGFINQQSIKKVVSQNDYGILIRPQRRSSNAGFPTKLGEYFAAGIPVLANDTGDICMYLKNNVNGIVLKGNKDTHILDALRKISQITKDDYSRMAENARYTAEKYFDYRNYIDLFQKLL